MVSGEGGRRELIDCDRALELDTMYAYLDGAADSGFSHELGEHYRLCPECADALDMERRFRDLVRDRGAHVMVPESLYIKTARILDNS